MSWHFLNMYGRDSGNRYESMSMTFERVIELEVKVEGEDEII